MFSFARHREFITGDVPSSNKDGNKDGGEAYESPVDENHFLNVFDSFVDKDGNTSIKRDDNFQQNFIFSLFIPNECFVS